MIYVGTQLQVSDNSGAKKLECIKVLGKKAGSPALLGDIIVVSVKDALPKHKSKVQKGEIYKAVIVETKQGIQRKDGSSLRLSQNSAILLSPQSSDPLGTRVLGRVTYELRKKNQTKILSLASHVF
jgi:large subunit ribosomal protein L14